MIRCMLVTVSEATGCKHPKLEPFATLKSYRPLYDWNGSLRPYLGVWCKVLKPGHVTVGDTIWLIRKTKPLE